MASQATSTLLEPIAPQNAVLLLVDRKCQDWDDKAR